MLIEDCLGNCGGGISLKGQYPESELYGRELAIFSECLDGENGFENGSVVILESDGTIVQYADSSFSWLDGPMTSAFVQLRWTH